MSFYGSIASSAATIASMSQAFETVSSNIVNASTDGYKTRSIRFNAEFNPQPYAVSPVTGSGASSYQYYNNDHPNPIISTGKANDFAINGQGFFITQENLTGGKILLTANGSFDRHSISNGNVIGGYDDFDTYLTDQHGHYLLGWTYDQASGNFAGGTPNLQTLEPINIRRFVPIVQLPKATENITLDANVPASKEEGASYEIIHRIYDGTGDSESDDSEVFLKMRFTKTSNFNEYVVSLHHAGTSDRGLFSHRPEDDLLVRFSGDGGTIESAVRQSTGTNVNIFSVGFAIPNFGGTDNTNVIAYDLSKMTNYNQGLDTAGDGQILQRNLSNDGNPYRIIHYKGTEVDEQGVVTIQYTHGIQSIVAKIPYGKVFNPRALITHAGPTLEATDESGDIQIFEFSKATTDETDAQTSSARLYQRAVNSSNTNLTQEFTHMITAQTAYNSATTVLRTIDEMIKRATDIKG